jgi:hypothetical protein
MRTHRQLDDSISRWLEADAPKQLPDRVLRATFERTRGTTQHGGLWAVLGRLHMNRLVLALGGAAVVVVAAAVALNLSGNQPGVGGQASPTTSPIPEATAKPSPTAMPRSDPQGDLPPGTYDAHPLPSPDDSLTLTFTVPAGWAALADPGQLTVLIPADEPGTQPPGGVGIQFIDVTTLNGDPCAWQGTADDVIVGPAVDDLVAALRAQTAYEVSEPVDVTIGGYSGKRVDVVIPTEPFDAETAFAPGCNEGRYRLWSTTAHGPGPVYAQGAANRWQTNILDVDGTRLVIVATDFPGTLPEDRAEMNAVVDSLAIEP